MNADGVPVIGVLVGTTRPTRVGRQVADEIVQMALLRSEAEVALVDLAEVDLPWMDEPKQPSRGDYQHQHTRDWAAQVAALDAVIVVSAQYNGGYPAPLKNAIDTLYAEWNDKPILLVTYGGPRGRGGASASAQLRTVFGVVRAKVLEPAITMLLEADDYGDDLALVNPCGVVERHRAELEVGFAAIHAALGC